MTYSWPMGSDSHSDNIRVRLQYPSFNQDINMFVTGMKIKQKFVSGDGTVAFGYKTSRLGIKKWCFYNTKQKSP